MRSTRACRLRVVQKSPRSSRVLQRSLLASAALLLAACHPGPELQVSITSPTGTVYTRGTVVVEATVTGGTPKSVSFVVAGQQLAFLNSAPYVYSWDTTSAPEGSYQVQMQATSKSGASFLSAPITVVVDRTPPTVVSFRPATNGIAPVDLAPTVTFSEPMLPSSVGPTSIVVTQGTTPTPVPVTLALSADGRRLSAALPATLALPVVLSGALNPGLTDLAGNALVIPPTQWAWTSVVDWAVIGGAVDSAAAGGSPAAVSLQVDSTLHEVVAYELNATSGVTVQVFGGQTWTSLGSAFGAGYDRPVLQLDSLDRPFVAVDQGGAAEAIAFYNGLWNPLPAIAKDSANVSIGVLSGELPALAWADPVQSAAVVYGADGGGSWSVLGGPQNPAPGQAVSQALMTSLGGQLVLAMDVHQASPAQDQIFVERWNGASWLSVGQPLNLGSNAQTAPLKGLGVDSYGDPIVLVAPSGSSLYVYSWNNVTWQSLGDGGVPLSGDVTTARMSSPSAGNPLVGLLQTLDGGQPNIALSRWRGSAWENIVGDPIDPGAQLQDWSIATDTTGSVYVGLAESTGGTVTVYVKQSNQ